MTKSTVKELKEVQLNFLAYRARTDFELYYDVDLIASSGQNIQQLKKQIQENIPENETALPSGFTSQEIHLVQYFKTHSKFTHGTQYLDAIENNKGKMQALQIRMRTPHKISNRHTDNGNRTDHYLFFSYGNKIPDFLPKEIDKVIFSPNAIQGHNALLYQHAFVTWYPQAAVQRRSSNPVLLGDCQFYCQHTDAGKFYFYQHKEKPLIKYSVTEKEELFYGKDILLGLAYKVVLHLRIIGGAYRWHILNTFSDDAVDENIKANIFETLYDIFYPIEFYPELKIPLQFEVNDKGVHIVKAVSINNTQQATFMSEWEQENQMLSQEKNSLQRIMKRQNELYYHPGKASSNYDKKTLLLRAVKQGIIYFATRILNENAFDVNEIYIDAPLLIIAINSINDKDKRFEMVNLLLEKGANPNVVDDHNENAYYAAVRKQDKDLFAYLLNVKCHHPQDPEVMTLPVLNKEKQILTDNNILSLICAMGLSDWLKVAVAYGANIDHFPNILYYKAASGQHIAVIAELIALGAALHSPSCVRMVKTPLMLFAQTGHVEGVELLLKKGVNVYTTYDGNTAQDYAKKYNHQNIVDLLAPYYIPDKPTAYQSKKFAAVAIVTADDKSTGNRLVLLGKRRNHDNTLDDEYCFPGGLLDTQDNDFIEAAIRELKEETGINLISKARPIQFTQQTFARYFHLYHSVQYDIRFIHFHIHSDYNTIRIQADDDLGYVKWLPIKDMRKGKDKYENPCYLIQENKKFTLLNQSNGIVLEGLFYGDFDKNAFEETLNIENTGSQLLTEYTLSDDVEKIKYLLRHHTSYQFKIKKYGNLLGFAAAAGSRNVVLFYLQWNPDLINVYPHPATSAAMSDEWEIFDLLYDGKLKEIEKLSILHYCISKKNVEKIIFCIVHIGVDINARLKQQQYFLNQAVAIGDLEVVKTLVENGAKVNPDFIGVDHDMTKVRPPLHIALIFRQEQIAIYLIEKGADINCRDQITRDSLFGNMKTAMENCTLDLFKSDDFPLIENEKERYEPHLMDINTNAIMKAITYKCSKVIDYIVDNQLYIDTSQLDCARVKLYQAQYPKLCALIPNHPTKVAL